MNVACSGWAGQQRQVLLPSPLACAVMIDSTRCLLPLACQFRGPTFMKATSCRAETPNQHVATGPAGSSIVFAAAPEGSAAPERSGKRPLDDQLQPASPVDGIETLNQPRRPVRLHSDFSDDSPPRSDRMPPQIPAAPPAAAPQQQRQQRGGRRRHGHGRMTPARARNLARNVELVASKNAEEVLAIVEKQLDAFNDVNAVTAFHRLARVCSRTLLGGPCLGTPLN